MRNISVKEMPFKEFSFYRLGGHFIQQSRTFCAILVKVLVKNISVKLF